jgi:hypothetical protein
MKNNGQLAATAKMHKVSALVQFRSHRGWNPASWWDRLHGEPTRARSSYKHGSRGGAYNPGGASHCDSPVRVLK